MCLKKLNISFRLFSLSLIIIKTGMFLVMFIFDIICLNHLTYVNVYVCFKLCNEKVPFTMRTIFSDLSLYALPKNTTLSAIFKKCSKMFEQRLMAINKILNLSTIKVAKIIQNK